MALKIYSVQETAKMFGTTPAKLKPQYQANLKTFREMHSKAVSTGKKVNGFTAAQLAEKVVRFEQKVADCDLPYNP